MVDTIWSGRSALSEEDDVKVLVFCRWLQNCELSPWNCILLTKEEAEAHAKLSDPTTEYGDALVSRVHHKHLRAKQHFVVLQSHLQRARKQAK
jgi:hypothetical protein